MQSKSYICFYTDVRLYNSTCSIAFQAFNRREAIKIGRAYVRKLNLDLHRKAYYFDSVHLMKRCNGKDSD